MRKLYEKFGQAEWLAAPLSAGYLSPAFDFVPIQQAAELAVRNNQEIQFIICGDGGSAEEVKNLIGTFMDKARQNLSNIIARGQSNGEFRTDKSADELANYVMYVKAGLLTASKVQLASQDPFSVAEMALSTLQ